MKIEEVMKAISEMPQNKREDFYVRIMEDFFKEMIENKKFMDTAFGVMAEYLKKMKKMGVDVSSILLEMEKQAGMKKAAC